MQAHQCAHAAGLALVLLVVAAVVVPPMAWLTYLPYLQSGRHKCCQRGNVRLRAKGRPATSVRLHTATPVCYHTQVVYATADCGGEVRSQRYASILRVECVPAGEALLETGNGTMLRVGGLARGWAGDRQLVVTLPRGRKGNHGDWHSLRTTVWVNERYGWNKG